MKKSYLILTLIFLIPNAYCMKRSSWFSVGRITSPLRTMFHKSNFAGQSYRSLLSRKSSKIFSTSRMLSPLYLNSRNYYNEDSRGILLPILIAGTALYQGSKWGRTVYAQQKEDESAALESLGNYIKTNFIQVITKKEGIKLFHDYCNQLRKQEDEGIFNKEMAVFANIFIESLTDIIALLPSTCVSDFFFRIVPVLEASLFKDYQEAMKKAFKLNCVKLVELCKNKDSYSLYALIKLFIKSNSEEHEKLFVDELFKHFNDLEDFYYLCVIQTKNGKNRSIEYCITHLADVCAKDELLDQLCYWIHCDPSLAAPFVTEQSIKILLTTGHGRFLIPHLLRAQPSAKNLVETVKKDLAIF